MIVKPEHIELSPTEIIWCHGMGQQRYQQLADRLRSQGKHKELEQYDARSHGYECMAEYAVVKALNGEKPICSPRFVVEERTMAKNVRVTPSCGSMILIRTDHVQAPIIFTNLMSARVIEVMGWIIAGAAMNPRQEGVYRGHSIYRAEREQLRSYTTYPPAMFRRQPGNSK